MQWFLGSLYASWLDLDLQRNLIVAGSQEIVNETHLTAVIYTFFKMLYKEPYILHLRFSSEILLRLKYESSCKFLHVYSHMPYKLNASLIALQLFTMHAYSNQNFNI